MIEAAMIEASPLATPGADPWLAGLAGYGLGLWLVRGPTADLDAALVALVGRGSPEPWRMEARGGRSLVRYIDEVGLAAGGRPDAAGMVGDAAAAGAVLDASASGGGVGKLGQPATGSSR